MWKKSQFWLAIIGVIVSVSLLAIWLSTNNAYTLFLSIFFILFAAANLCQAGYKVIYSENKYEILWYFKKIAEYDQSAIKNLLMIPRHSSHGRLCNKSTWIFFKDDRSFKLNSTWTFFEELWNILRLSHTIFWKYDIGDVPIETPKISIPIILKNKRLMWVYFISIIICLTMLYGLIKYGGVNSCSSSFIPVYLIILFFSIVGYLSSLCTINIYKDKIVKTFAGIVINEKSMEDVKEIFLIPKNKINGYYFDKYISIHFADGNIEEFTSNMSGFENLWNYFHEEIGLGRNH